MSSNGLGKAGKITGILVGASVLLSGHATVIIALTASTVAKDRAKEIQAHAASEDPHPKWAEWLRRIEGKLDRVVGE